MLMVYSGVFGADGAGIQVDEGRAGGYGFLRYRAEVNRVLTRSST